MTLNRFFNAAVIIISLAQTTQCAKCEISAEDLPGNAGHELRIFKQVYGLANVQEFRLTAPAKKDTQILLSFPASFTNAKGKIEGLAICNGKNVGGTIDPKFGGAAIFVNGDFEIISTDNGKLLSPRFLSELQKAHGSLYQQYLLLKNGEPQVFKDTTKVQRRALILLPFNEKALIETKGETTLNEFAKELKAIKVRQAIYAPTGKGDDGWYRESGKAIDMAKVPSSGQSSWVVFKNADKQPEGMATANWLKKQLNPADAPLGSTAASWTNAIRYGIFPLPKLVGEGFDLIPLWDGYYSTDEGLDFSLEMVASGIVDGQPAAAAFASYSTGGTGVFEYIVLYRKVGNKVKVIGYYALEDRGQVNSVKIIDGAVVVDCVLHKPEDPAPSPSLKKVLKLHQKDFTLLKLFGKYFI